MYKDAWEKSVIDDVPISTRLPNNWPVLPAGLISDPGIVLDQLVSRNEAEKDGRSVKGVTIMPAKFADMILADELKNTNKLKKKEPTIQTETGMEEQIKNKTACDS